VTTFDLVLLGYRNDLARERAIAFLRRLPPDIGSVDLHRDCPLPHVLLADLDHGVGLRLAAELRKRGAQVRLCGSDGTQAPEAAPPPPPAFSATRALVLGAMLVATLGAARYLQIRRPALPPAAPPAIAADIGAPAARTELRRNPLNDEAVELNSAGRFAEATERLRTAIGLSPEHDILYANLVTVLRNWAVSEINEGRHARAVELLEEALRHSDDANLLSLLGIAQERAGKWHEAEETLRTALERGAGEAMAFIALGRVYRQRGDREGAVEMFQRAREIGAAGPDFDSMLGRLERELDAEWDFVEISTPHFRLSFAQGEDREAAHIVSSVLEDAYFAVGRKLDLYPEAPTEVVLYASEDFHTVTQTPDWTGGVYDGRIKLPVRGISGGSELLQRTLRHEYGHVLVTMLTGGRIPVWLNEGLAIWAEEDEDGDREDWAHGIIAGQRLFTLVELEPTFTRLPAERVQVAYAQSYLAVRLLLAEYGERRLIDLLRRAGGKDRIEKQHEAGKLTARERIDRLLDPGTFVELDKFKTHRCTEFDMADKKTYGDGVVTGYGQIDGRYVCVFSQDFTVFGGSLGEAFAQKVCKVMDFAMRQGYPVVGLNDSGGARIQEGRRQPRRLRRHLPAQRPGLRRGAADLGDHGPLRRRRRVLAGHDRLHLHGREEHSYMFITGPDVIKTVTREEVTMEALGGAITTRTSSGVAHLHTPRRRGLPGAGPRAALVPAPRTTPRTRPSSRRGPPSPREAELDTTSCPRTRTSPTTSSDVIRRVVDDGDFFEVQPDYAQEHRRRLRPHRRPQRRHRRQPALGARRRARHRLRRSRPRASCASATASTSRSSPSSTSPASCPAPPRSTAASSSTAPSCSTPTARRRCRRSPSSPARPTAAPTTSWRRSTSAATSTSPGPTAEIAVMGPDGAVNIIFRKEIKEAGDDPEARRAGRQLPQGLRQSRTRRPSSATSTTSSSPKTPARTSSRRSTC
jgi:propionyl-CoA carboxylase beta chain